KVRRRHGQHRCRPDGTSLWIAHPTPTTDGPDQMARKFWLAIGKVNDLIGDCGEACRNCFIVPGALANHITRLASVTIDTSIAMGSAGGGLEPVLKTRNGFVHVGSDAKFRGTLRSGCELFGVERPLIGWRAQTKCRVFEYLVQETETDMAKTNPKPIQPKAR